MRTLIVLEGDDIKLGAEQKDAQLKEVEWDKGIWGQDGHINIYVHSMARRLRWAVLTERLSYLVCPADGPVPNHTSWFAHTDYRAGCICPLRALINT